MKKKKMEISKEQKLKQDSSIMSELLSALDMTGNELSKELKYSSNSSIYGILQGNRGISISLIYKIKDRFPYVNEEFLKSYNKPILLKDPEDIIKENLNTFRPTFEDVPRLLSDIKNLLEQQLEYLKNASK
ncbi:hypothetical protein [Wenyingzhuangia sp. IMCC45574]